MRFPVGHIVAVVLAALPLQGAAQSRISVTGVGQVARTPDLATLSLGAAFEAGTAGEAVDQVGAALAATLAVLAEAGIAPEDVQTRALNLYPVYPDRSGPGAPPPGAEAFRAESGLSVVVRDLDALGPVVDALLGSGANMFNGLTFGLSDPAPAEDEARVAAVQDATRKARILAEAAGLTLGPVQLITEQQSYDGPMPMAEFAVSRDRMPIAQGQLTVSVRVQMEWELVEDRG